jgi:hypothetical protein
MGGHDLGFPFPSLLGWWLGQPSLPNLGLLGQLWGQPWGPVGQFWTLGQAGTGKGAFLGLPVAFLGHPWAWPGWPGGGLGLGAWGWLAGWVACLPGWPGPGVACWPGGLAGLGLVPGVRAGSGLGTTASSAAGPPLRSCAAARTGRASPGRLPVLAAG